MYFSTNFLPATIFNCCKPVVIFCLTSLLVLPACGPQNKLNRTWPIHRGLNMTPYDYANVEHGFVLKKNGDTVRGYLKMVVDYPDGGSFDHVPVLPYGKTQAADIINIPLLQIDYAQIGNTWPHARDTTDFMPVNDAMWHVLGRKGNASICQGLYIEGPFWGDQLHYRAPIALIVGGKITAIPTKISPYRSLFLFANQRYNQPLAHKDFKQTKDLIDYILNKEAAKTTI
jgi:hypothetical protein